MKELKTITLTEKEWKYIKSCYRRFNKGERDCSLCPMGWETQPTVYDSSLINLHIWNKLNYLDGSVNDGDIICICHQFPEFKKAAESGNCPCHEYTKIIAFAQLQKLINRWCEEDV